MKIDWMKEKGTEAYQKEIEEETEMDRRIEEIERYRRKENPLSNPDGTTRFKKKSME